MKKISIIFILLSFSSFIWADNNEKGVYVAIYTYKKAQEFSLSLLLS